MKTITLTVTINACVPNDVDTNSIYLLNQPNDFFLANNQQKHGIADAEVTGFCTENVTEDED